MPSPEQPQQLEGGAYEVIRARLATHGDDLRTRLASLNEDRKAIFGAIETSLVSTERVTTQHNCVPRDIIAIGPNRFLFGYNIQFGLKQTTDISDVFAVYDYTPEDHTFHNVPVSEALSVGNFPDDFAYLYKYYKNTTFVKFMQIGAHLYIVLRIGKGIDDIKVCKFLCPGDGSINYEGNRFDHEYVFPLQQEFEWIRAHRDMQRSGEHPHISIEDRLFVETIGGDLTIKIEDNTSSGQGIYAEDVTNADQSLDDAEILYATVGPFILLKILPYQEKHYRYLLYNEKTQNVHRLDAIGHSCVLLPDDQGLIFANGYKLITGELKTFDHGLDNMVFERRITSSNGEDTLYVFYNRLSGDYVLLSYNLINQSVETPIVCNGFSLFPNGELIYFRTEEQPQKHHTLQVWQTPYVIDVAATSDHEASFTEAQKYINKIGNPDLVAAMAEIRIVLALLQKDDTFSGLYIDLVKTTQDLIDSYFWIDRSETHQLSIPLKELNGTANAAIEEFEKVQRLRQSTAATTESVVTASKKLLRDVETSVPEDILGFVHHLAELRRLRGEVIGLRDLRYHDAALIESLEVRITEATGKTSNETVEFLLKEEALSPYRAAVDEQKDAIPKLKKVTEADDVAENITKAGAELELLIDVVGNLKIEDATQTTAIIDSISTIYATLNGVKSELKQKRLALAKSEGTAQFGAQMKLLSQTVANYLDLCDSPEKTEEYLTKVMIQLEELEGKFAEFDDYVEEITSKREEVYDAFETRKTQLLEQRQKRTATLVKSADRILSGIKNRIAAYTDINEINGYFAGDLMIEKVRDLITSLTDLGDSVKADDIQTQLKTIREDAVRQLKDRNELYVDGKNVIRFGKHAFNVNTQDLELSIVPHDDEMCFHLGGTRFYDPIVDETFLSTQAVWSQELISENDDVYRAEYAAYQFLRRRGLQPLESTSETLTQQIQAFLQPRYSEGYTKGVHDLDVIKILEALLPIHENIDLLHYSPTLRAEAIVFWLSWSGKEKDILTAKLKARANRGGDSQSPSPFEGSWKNQITEAMHTHGFTTGSRGHASYLIDQLTSSDGFIASRPAADFVTAFRQHLVSKNSKASFQETLATLSDHPQAQYEVIVDWISVSLDIVSQDNSAPYIQEAAAHIAVATTSGREADTIPPQNIHDVELETTITGLSGSHPRLTDGTLALNYNEFITRLENFTNTAVPTYQSYQQTKQDLLEVTREDMRLDEFKPRVMSAFVRNRLLNEVYLPLIGDNLAKQLGTAGVDTRTDRMGMLLLISPPGYGKTTLMEYIANRLGITFMKINGPALGHHVTSLDPGEAPNASAREEVEKLNLALEMGDNVMIYLDDIQHCNPEFLQKFISLCDAQRKIEGIYKGQAKTYDLRGRKVAVVMAGNPYTETGGKFQIPDMLANRADTYNLGDILGGHADAFKASYIENSLTSNSILSKLSSRSQKDVYAIMHLAEHGADESVDFEGNYTPAEIDELVKVTRHLISVRNTILRVNLEYIRSAAQEDAYRTEPAFKLQGSYRNMNRIAEKILPLMTDEEVRALVIDHYTSESQTLTTGAEANMLKFKELEDLLEEQDIERWEEIKKGFTKQKLLGGAGENDPIARVVAQLSQFNDGLSALNESAKLHTQPQDLSSTTIEHLEKIIGSLRAVPVEVDIKVIPVQEDGETPRPDAKSPVKTDTTIKQKP